MFLECVGTNREWGSYLFFFLILSRSNFNDDSTVIDNFI